MRVILQAGHLNIKNNCDAALRGSTGAGGEVQVNEAIRNATAELLKANGVEVLKVDANYNCDATSLDEDWNLFLALHCDMDYAGDNGSGFCDFPEPETDGATAESQRLAREIENVFFPEVGINVKSRSNANTRFYYMWASLSKNTPCVLIEMGQVQDAHDKPILQDTDKVSKALAKAILSALGIKDVKDIRIEELENELQEMRTFRNKWKADYKALQEETNKDIADLITHRDLLQKDLSEANAQIETLKKAIMTNKTPLSAYTIKERIDSIVKSLFIGGDIQ